MSELREGATASSRRERAGTLFRAIVHEVRVERVTFMAGSLAYHAFVSMLPLFLLLMAIVSTVGDQRLEGALLSLAEAAVTPGAGEALVSELRSASPGASALGVVVLVWGTLRIFRSLDVAFSTIYETEAENTFRDQFVDGLIVFVSVSATLLVAAGIEAAITPNIGGTVGWLLSRLALVAGVGVALLPMYYLFPDEEGMAVREVVPGVLFAAVGLVALESLFRLYVAYSSTAQRGSVLASIIVFLTWLYFTGLVVLLGVAVNAVLSNRSRDVNVKPVIGGVPAEAERGGVTGGEAPIESIERLRQTLPTASEIDVVVDGETVPLTRPERVDADVERSNLPIVDGSVGLSIRWSGGSDERSETGE